MRISSETDVPQVDLAAVRRLVPACWSEWDELRFTSDGWLRDPDTEQPLGALRLVHGRHRVPGAQYAIVNDTEHLSFVLASDTGRAVQGTLSSQWWSAELDIGEQISAVGRVDVGAAMRANDVPGLLITLIGAQEATGRVGIDPSRLDRGGDLVRGEGAAQRCAGDVTVGVRTGLDGWHVRIAVDLTGRGLIGRVAFRACRSKARSSIQEGLDELLADTAGDGATLRSELGQLEDRIRAADGEQAFVHRYFWEAVRRRATPDDVPAATSLAAPFPGQATASGTTAADSPVQLRRGPLGVRRLQRHTELRFPAPSERYLIDHGSLRKLDQLIVRSGQDRLRAHFPSNGRTDYPPTFHAGVERQTNALTITGTIRETRAARAWSLVWGFVTGLMALIAIVGVVGVTSGTGGALAPLLIGVIAGPLFALFWRGARRDRRPDFTRQAAELEDGLQRWFTSGDGNRRYLT